MGSDVQPVLCVRKLGLIDKNIKKTKTMNFQPLLIGGLLVGLGLLVGCASTPNRLSQAVTVPSAPIGVSVSIDKTPPGPAPVFSDLTRGAEHTITIKMPGYKETHITLSNNGSGWAWGNILMSFGGIVGLVVDATSGSLYSLSPIQVSAELRKGNLGNSEYKDGVLVVAALQASPSWTQVGQLERE